jgi:hypothetical protein
MNLKIALNNFLERWFLPSPKPLLMTEDILARLLDKIENIVDVLEEDGRKYPAAYFTTFKEIIINADETAIRKYVLHDDFLGSSGVWDTYLENKYRLIKYQVFVSQLLGIIQYMGIDNERIRFIKDKVGHGFLTSYKDQLDDDILRLGYPERKEDADSQTPKGS